MAGLGPGFGGGSFFFFLVSLLFPAARSNKFFFRSAILCVDVVLTKEEALDNAVCDGRVGLFGLGLACCMRLCSNATCDGLDFLGGGDFFFCCCCCCSVTDDNPFRSNALFDGRVLLGGGGVSNLGVPISTNDFLGGGTFLRGGVLLTLFTLPYLFIVDCS